MKNMFVKIYSRGTIVDIGIGLHVLSWCRNVPFFWNYQVLTKNINIKFIVEDYACRLIFNIFGVICCVEDYVCNPLIECNLYCFQYYRLWTGTSTVCLP